MVDIYSDEKEFVKNLIQKEFGLKCTVSNPVKPDEFIVYTYNSGIPNSEMPVFRVIPELVNEFKVIEIWNHTNEIPEFAKPVRNMNGCFYNNYGYWEEVELSSI
mgnify:CR=1 FL=1